MSEPRWMDADAAARYLCIRVDAFPRAKFLIDAPIDDVPVPSFTKGPPNA